MKLFKRNTRFYWLNKWAMANVTGNMLNFINL